jgi:hypothetical protein
VGVRQHAVVLRGETPTRNKQWGHTHSIDIDGCCCAAVVGCRILDNLPIAMVRTRKDESGKPVKVYERGFYVGFKATIEVRAWRGGRLGGCGLSRVVAGVTVGGLCLFLWIKDRGAVLTIPGVRREAVVVVQCKQGVVVHVWCGAL